MRPIFLRLSQASKQLGETPITRFRSNRIVANGSPTSHIPKTGFSTNSIAFSGHSRWSTIKHDKGRNDRMRGAEFSRLSRDIITASKMEGLDSLRLKQAIAAAKKAGMSKEKIEGAVRKGQGITVEGVEYQALIVEAMGPCGVAIIIDCLTDNKLRTMQNVKYTITKNGGTVTPIAYMFSRKGKVTLSPAADYAENLDALFERVLEMTMEIEGVEDVELVQNDGKQQIQVTTPPDKVGQVSKEISGNMSEAKVEKFTVEWIPNEETMVAEGEGKEWEELGELIGKIENEDDVEEVYTNVKPSR